MTSRTRWIRPVALSLFAALLVAVTETWTPGVVAAEPDPASPEAAQDRERPPEREGALRERIAAQERQLAELERMINEARERGQQDRLEALVREADEIRRQMGEQGRDQRDRPRDEPRREQRERDQRIRDERAPDERIPEEERVRRQREEAEQMDRQGRELEERRRGLEMERAELAASFGRLELVGRIAEISRSDETAAAFAVMHVERFMEMPQAIDFLHEMLEQSQNETVRRMIRIRLVELDAGVDRRDDVREQLKQLILGK